MLPQCLVSIYFPGSLWGVNDALAQSKYAHKYKTKTVFVDLTDQRHAGGVLLVKPRPGEDRVNKPTHGR